MKKATQHLMVLSLMISTGLSAQVGQKKAPAQRERPAAERLTLRPEAARNLPIVENPFGITAPQYKPAGALRTPAKVSGITVVRDADGTPLCYRGTSDSKITLAEFGSPVSAARTYVKIVQPEGIQQPELEFSVIADQTDEQGNHHVRMEQRWNGVPVYGCEIIAHTQNGVFNMLNGRFVPSPTLADMAPAVTLEQAIDAVKNAVGSEKIKNDWSEMDLKVIGSNSPYTGQLVIYPVKNDYHYAWHITAHPNLMERVVYFVDAQTGAVLHHYDQTCRLHAHNGVHQHNDTDADAVGPVTASGLDLLGVNRSFGAWQDGNTVYMEDASQPMFNSASQMPDEPEGAIVTLDAKNTSPEVQQSFDFDFVKSSSSTFNNTTAVSAHWNSIKSYQYFKNKFNRNSIDGNGGNIISFINVAESDGSSMENAFWNGASMWYGNGGSTFRKLARGLDVGGHEMTHGVVEKTANLEYQGESGALNESFADVFGAMIDAGDWLIGEDVMQPNTHTCLRDLSNPNNGVSQSSPFWQPAHVNQQYTGNQDNGGVHINSGIVNKAFYLFATSSAVGTDKAEQVYYKALRDYLVKSSKFVDCRIAVIQAATDLYGNTVANAAASAFDQVGIGGSAPSGNYLGQLSLNPGVPLILCVSDNNSSVDLADANGNVLGTVYNEAGIESRPSISDNGLSAIFVNQEKHLILMDFSYDNGQVNVQSTQLSSFPEWRNAAISKDGRFVAAITDADDNNIYVFDLLSPSLANTTLTLFNPTYTQGQSTGNVLYADVMEFDYSGQYIMYDAYNELSNTQGQAFNYWDIGFVKFWENGAYANNNNLQISKLFSGIPDNVSIGNPTFSKLSPYIIAFDYFDEASNQHDLLGANIETGDYDAIASNINTWGWANYDLEDKSILYNRSATNGTNLVKQGVNSTKIQPQGNSQVWVDDHAYGVWYGNGNRSLMVSTQDAGAWQQMAVKVLPNPTSGNVQMRFQSAAASDMRIAVVDMLGTVLRTFTVQPQAGENFFDLDLNGLPAGAYMIRMDSEAGSGAIKILKY